VAVGGWQWQWLGGSGWVAVTFFFFFGVFVTDFENYLSLDTVFFLFLFCEFR
jgi:hypothetical protein